MIMNQEHDIGGCKILNRNFQNNCLKLAGIPCILQNNECFRVEWLKVTLCFPVEEILRGNLIKERHVLV